MLDHRNIRLELNTDYKDVARRNTFTRMVYTGPIDAFFEYRYGKLPYRSLNFEYRVMEQEWHQSVAIVNYPSENVPYTRSTEFKYLTGQRHHKTCVGYEFPSGSGDPYYPIPRSDNESLYEKYRTLTEATPNISFLGRLATYKYYNMDQVIAQALTLCAKLMGTSFEAVAAGTRSLEGGRSMIQPVCR
jgi:UDP-galactopyranose mutase